MRYYEGVRAIPRFFWKVFGSMYFHFQNQKGWMNDPNGLIYYKGKYHAFFQHYPYAPRWGQMHWGHAVSENLLDWEELDIALCPDEPYENDGGCFSGSAIEKDGRLYLFYTSVSHELGQTQSVAFSDDGITFTKYENNPVIKESPLGSNREFRDPKVFEYEGGYRMVVGAGIDNIGKLLLFKSDNLLDWEYVGELISDLDFGPCIECPDVFEIDGKWVMMFSSIKSRPHRVNFAVGLFDGEKFIFDNSDDPFFSLEIGPDFYAPQTFEAPDQRRILISWMYNWSKSIPAGATHVGAFTIPRELKFNFDDKLTMRPIKEVMPFIKKESKYVSYDEGLLCVRYEGKTLFKIPLAEEPKTEILEDVGTVEVFLDGGLKTITTYIC